MLSEIWKAIMITSLAGTILACMITIIRPVTKKMFGYSWHYYIWLAVLVVMLLPVQLPMPVRMDQAPITPITQTEQKERTAITEPKQNSDNASQSIQTAPKTNILQRGVDVVKRIGDNRENVLAFLWLMGALSLFAATIFSYIRLNVKMRKNSVVISCPEIAEYTNKKIIVRVWENLSSPFMTGISEPTLVLPDGELSKEQLHNILRHEMTHFKRRDILYKWFAQLVKCLHWFNPVIWYVTKQISIECEISCDMLVVQGMNKDEEVSYINTILALLPKGGPKHIPLTTQMASSKKILRRRFMMIKNKRATSKLISVLSAMLAVVMLSTTVLASGVLSGLAEDNYTIEITNRGEKMELTNKPFIENGEVYLPLREIFEKVGALKNPSSEIRWSDGSISIILLPEREEQIDGKIGLDFQMLIGNNKLMRRIVHGDFESDYKPYRMWNGPVLKNSTTYIPFEYVDFMLNTKGEEQFDIDYTIFDKTGGEKTTEVIKGMSRALAFNEAVKIAPDYSNEQSLCYDTIASFRDEFNHGRIENTKQYCTDYFVKTAFSDNAFFKNQSGEIWSVHSINLYPDGNYRVTFSFYPHTLNDNPQIYVAVMEKQTDGRFLIQDIIPESEN